MAVLKYSKVLLLVLLIATGLSCVGIYWLGKEQNRLLNEQWHALNIRIINDLGTKTELDIFYEKADESLLTLEDLVQDKESFRATLKTILVSAKNEAEIQVQKDILEMFESDDWSAIPFAYTENL